MGGKKWLGRRIRAQRRRNYFQKSYRLLLQFKTHFIYEDKLCRGMADDPFLNSKEENSLQKS